jgi:hypothetical protein
VAKVGTSKVGGTISQQAAVHPWLAADAHGNKQTNLLRHLVQDTVDVDVVEELHSSSRLEDFDVLECGATSLGDYYPMFRDVAVVSFSGVKCHTFRPLKTSRDVS